MIAEELVQKRLAARFRHVQVDVDVALVALDVPEPVRGVPLGPVGQATVNPSLINDSAPEV
jgi:hypothetical protein